MVCIQTASGITYFWRMFTKLLLFFEKVTASKKIVLSILGLVTVLITIQSLLLGDKVYVEGGNVYNHYNNYSIFKYAYYHLISNADLYILHPHEHWDLYKYSPAFAAFMGLFWYLPDWLGLLLWNGLNVGVLALGVYSLPLATQKKGGFILLFALLETIVATQNDQSNALMAGLILLGYSHFKRDIFITSTLFLSLTVFIKIFGLVAFCIYLWKPKKLAQVAGFSVGWFVALAVIVPLLFVDFNQLTFLYQSWGDLLANDHSTSVGLSVAGWLQSWFAFTPKDTYILFLGVLLFLLGYVSTLKKSTLAQQLSVVASLLIWVVIFNHKAESPTFVIAMVGASIWYISKEQPNKWDKALMIFTFVFTSLSTTDLVPPSVRRNLVDTYVLKAFPLILVWCKIIGAQILVLPSMLKTSTKE